MHDKQFDDEDSEGAPDRIDPEVEFEDDSDSLYAIRDEELTRVNYTAASVGFTFVTAIAVVYGIWFRVDVDGLWILAVIAACVALIFASKAAAKPLVRKLQPGKIESLFLFNAVASPAMLAVVALRQAGVDDPSTYLFALLPIVAVPSIRRFYLIPI